MIGPNARNIFCKRKPIESIVIQNDMIIFHFCRRKQSNPNQCGVVDLFKEFISIFVFDVMNAFFINLGDLIKSINSEYTSSQIYSISRSSLNIYVWPPLNSGPRNCHHCHPAVLHERHSIHIDPFDIQICAESISLGEGNPSKSPCGAHHRSSASYHPHCPWR